MNNDNELCSPGNFRDVAATGDVWRNALCKIASEIQRYYQTDSGGLQLTEPLSTKLMTNVQSKPFDLELDFLTMFKFEFEIEEENLNKNRDHVNIFEKMNKCTTKIITKNRKLKKLKQDLKIACNVAKIIISAKIRETEQLTHHLNVTLGESLELKKNEVQNLSLIKQLRMEKDNSDNEVKLISNFIHLGYNKLQEMRNEKHTDIPLIKELETILLACGQYYADYCNERDRCTQFEQRNRFLNNKLKILENNLAATTEELRNLRIQNMRLRVRCEMKHRNIGMVKNLTNPSISEMFLDTRLRSDTFDIPDDENALKTIEYIHELENYKRLHFTSHLDTVRSLVSDQDQILEELKKLYQEVHIPE